MLRLVSAKLSREPVLFDLFKAFDYIESSHKSDIFYPKMLIFLHAHIMGSTISTMDIVFTD